jgi:hypothetical protein
MKYFDELKKSMNYLATNDKTGTSIPIFPCISRKDSEGSIKKMIVFLISGNISPKILGS